MFEGHGVALVTPFRDGALDPDGFRALVDRVVGGGARVLVPCGTTGEAPTLTEPEREALIRICVESSRGKAKVLAGAGTNCTASTIRNAKVAEECGADGVLLVTPYYNKPPQEGLYRHFMDVADATALPVVLYNVPSRTAVDLLPETVRRLATHGRIVGIKEAKGDPERVKPLLDTGITVLSGDDALTVVMREAGASGVISVAGNIVPDQITAMCELPIPEARKVHDRLRGLFEALFVETNPIPVKAALELMDEMSGQVRLPLVAASESTRARMSRELRSLGLVA